MKKSILILFSSFCFVNSYGQESPEIDSLFRNSYTVFELQRLPNGMYRDATLFSGSDYHPISIANTGMGLIALCIADAMGWINNGSELALNTIKTATGHTSGFLPDRTSNGYYRHFMDINTGQQAWNSEYSTIDSAILVSGALFSMNYFQHDSISHYTTELWNSINFNDAIDNSSTGQIYLSMDSDGNGINNSLTRPYNEYMIVAWLAKNYSSESNNLGTILWNNHYSSPSLLPSISYQGSSVLSDNNNSFLSSFTHQFNYFLCNYFTTSTEYLTYFKNSQEADRSWWQNMDYNLFEWGLGAGSAITSSYHADAINNNEDLIVSPQIIAGYIPVNLESKSNLIDLWNSNLGKFNLPNVNNDPILWRYSKSNTTWIPNEIIGIDYSSMLFGLSTLTEYLGIDFFSTYNDFFTSSSLSIDQLEPTFEIKVYPNPTSDHLYIELGKFYKNISISIINSLGQPVLRNTYDNLEKINIPLKLHKGLYLLTLDFSEGIETFKVIIR